jgi:hypothetical protein
MVFGASDLLHVVTGVYVHATLQAPGVPLRASVVHAWLSLQLTGQLPSHFSGASVTPLPHTGVQALSLSALQPEGQHESPFPHAVMGA